MASLCFCARKKSFAWSWRTGEVWGSCFPFTGNPSALWGLFLQEFQLLNSWFSLFWLTATILLPGCGKKRLLLALPGHLALNIVALMWCFTIGLQSCSSWTVRVLTCMLSVSLVMATVTLMCCGICWAPCLHFALPWAVDPNPFMWGSYKGSLGSCPERRLHEGLFLVGQCGLKSILVSHSWKYALHSRWSVESHSTCSFFLMCRLIPVEEHHRPL